MKYASLRNGFIIIFFCSVLFLNTIGFSQSYQDIPDNNLSYPVLLISKTGTTGSGFYYNKENATYLITARHVLFKETTTRVSKQFVVPKTLEHKFICTEDTAKKEFILTFYGVMSEQDRDRLLKVAPTGQDNVGKAIEKLYKESQNLKLRDNEIGLFSNEPKIFGEGLNEMQVQLGKLYESGLVKYHPSHDVAYIKIGIPKKGTEESINLFEGVTKKKGAGYVGLGKDNFKVFKDVIVGNSVYVFGYPTSITSIDPWLDISIPLLRKGIVAGKNDVLKAIILDCPGFNGNSGGLVIEVDRTSKDTKYIAIGIITNMVIYNHHWLQNSGYSIVVPMNFVEELIAFDE